MRTKAKRMAVADRRRLERAAQRELDASKARRAAAAPDERDAVEAVDAALAAGRDPAALGEAVVDGSRRWFLQRVDAEVEAAEFHLRRRARLIAAGRREAPSAAMRPGGSTRTKIACCRAVEYTRRAGLNAGLIRQRLGAVYRKAAAPRLQAVYRLTISKSRDAAAQDRLRKAIDAGGAEAVQTAARAAALAAARYADLLPAELARGVRHRAGRCERLAAAFGMRVLASRKTRFGAVAVLAPPAA